MFMMEGGSVCCDMRISQQRVCNVIRLRCAYCVNSSKNAEKKISIERSKQVFTWVNLYYDKVHLDYVPIARDFVQRYPKELQTKAS